ncbi:MAG: hydroxyacid dehydrogenase [Bacteroidetes bacterium]|nr:hydroxyacid dehydrogenase [Bacteroidota bacterium]
MKMFFLDSIHPSLKKELEKNNFICDEDFISSKEEIEKKVSQYDGIILRSRLKIDKKFIDCFVPSLKGRVREGLHFIARVGAGMEHIDVAYAESKGIKCISSPEGNRNAVAEHALGMLLSLLNNISKANAEVKEGKWIREANRGTELEGKTIGIYGYGNTGSAFAKVLRGFDVKILAYDKYKAVSLPLGGGAGGGLYQSTPEKIFSETDVLSLHLPLTGETNYLVNDSFTSKFKKNIYLINTSRGQIVKTDDLVKNLKSGKILGACLDVLEYEETSFEFLSPSGGGEGGGQSFQYLKSSNKVILTPHIAGWSFESSEKMAIILAEKIISLTSK